MSKITTLPNGHLAVEGARIIFRNFEGRMQDYNNAGDRNFCLVIDDEETANQLAAAGWNIKQRVSSQDPDAVFYFTKVKVSYKIVAPVIELISSRGRQSLSEDTAMTVDRANFTNIDIEISPSHWEMNGKTGVTGYLVALYGTIAEDYFGAKYGNETGLDPELPFN